MSHDVDSARRRNRWRMEMAEDIVYMQTMHRSKEEILDDYMSLYNIHILPNMSDEDLVEEWEGTHMRPYENPLPNAEYENNGFSGESDYWKWKEE